MPFVIGIVLAFTTALLGSKARLDRDRAFYPTVLIVVGSYYVLFAAMSGSVEVLLVETIAMMVFLAAAIAGFKSNTWIVVAALVGHGIFDAIHGQLVDNSGVPAWWPPFCMAYDICAGACLAWLFEIRGTRVDERGDLAQLCARLRS